MERKNVTQVVIDGKIYKLGGYESEEYLHQVASYLNNKITELKSLDGYLHLPAAMKSLMLDLNTADDYFKVKKQADRLENEMSDKDRELYQIKHELVSLQVKQEDAAKQILSYREEISDYQKRIVELETRLPASASAAAAASSGKTPEGEEEKADLTENAGKAQELPEDISPDVSANDSWTERYSQALAEGAEAREPGTQMPEFFSESASGNSAGNAGEADLQADAGTLSGSGAAAVKETAAEKKERR